MWDNDSYDWSEEGACEDAYEDAMDRMLVENEESLEFDNYWESLSDEEKRKQVLIQEIPNVMDRSKMYLEHLLGYTPSKNQLKNEKRHIFYYRGFYKAIKHYLVDLDSEEIADDCTINFNALKLSDEAMEDRNNELWNALYDGYVSGYSYSVINVTV